MKEVWKDVKDFEGYYQISNFGRVKGLDRYYYTKNGIKKFCKGIELKACVNGSGYLLVCLHGVGRKKSMHVHQLVAMAFLNHIPYSRSIVIDHIDNNRLNNNVSNLQIITARENCTKDKKGGTSKYLGVCWRNSGKKWQVAIKINGKIKHLGYFDDEIEAAEAYKNKRREIENKQQ